MKTKLIFASMLLVQLSMTSCEKEALEDSEVHQTKSASENEDTTGDANGNENSAGDNSSGSVLGSPDEQEIGDVVTDGIKIYEENSAGDNSAGSLLGYPDGQEIGDVVTDEIKVFEENSAGDSSVN